MEIISDFELQRKSCHQHIVHLSNDDKRLSIDGENRFFHSNVTFSDLHHPQFCIEVNKIENLGRQFICQSPNNTSDLVCIFKMIVWKAQGISQ